MGTCRLAPLVAAAALATLFAAQPAAASTSSRGLRDATGAAVRADASDFQTVKSSKKKKRRAKKSKKSKRETGAEGDEGNPLWDLVLTINGFYPVVLDENLEPEVHDKVVPLWVTSVFCGELCGALWIPMVIVGEWPGEEYFLFALIGYAIQTVLVTLGFVTSYTGIGAIWSTFVLVYLTPVGIIDDYDRALKRERAKGTEALRGKGKNALLRPRRARAILY